MPQQQQQQRFADLDLLAVFSDREKAEAAAAKLRKEGFSEEEIVRPEAATVMGSGQFREHGPNTNRGAQFLQTSRGGPNFALVITLAIVFGLVLALILFALHFAFAALPEPGAVILGAAVGIILGAVIGLLRRGPERGNIGQNMARVQAATRPPGDYIAVGVRFEDPTNVARTSRARAILINNGGKIDRSVGRRE
ncbi:MAG TPA: hypothetical protein VKV40_00785 [Ktedonobacteraceae bacterium]|nr:hypothetical protein [Ktedonobacteraceae bacterium]